MRVTIQLCRFKRHQNSPWENGVMLDEDKAIVDEAGRIVPAPIWSYHNTYSYGYIVLDGDPAGDANQFRKTAAPGAT